MLIFFPCFSISCSWQLYFLGVCRVQYSQACYFSACNTAVLKQLQFILLQKTQLYLLLCYFTSTCPSLVAVFSLRFMSINNYFAFSFIFILIKLSFLLLQLPYSSRLHYRSSGSKGQPALSVTSLRPGFKLNYADQTLISLL